MKHSHRPKQNQAAEELFEYRSIEKTKLKQVMALTGIMMFVEIVGGVFTNSLALISDAGHMFTHAFALLISFLAIICGGKAESQPQDFRVLQNRDIVGAV